MQLQAAEMEWRSGCWMDAGWQSVDRCGLASCGWFGRGGVGSEAWFGRLQLSDAVNTISLQGWWSLKQSELAKERLGPSIFGGDANLARWAAELDCFGRDSFKYSGSSTRCHKDVGNGMFQASHRIESITRERSQAGMFQPRLQQAKE